jgi:putative ABC transport system substrate-binding protein
MMLLAIAEDRTMQRCTLRLLVTLALAILVPPLVTNVQPAGKVYRIGFLRAGQPPPAWVEAFQQGLREQGYIEGQNVSVEYRVTDGSLDPLPQLAEELVQSKVDVILASSSPPAVAAKKSDHVSAYCLCGSVSKVEMVTPKGLIFRGLFPLISTFETPPFFL